jgi:hypothetical protein
VIGVAADGGGQDIPRDQSRCRAGLTRERAPWANGH